MLVVDDDENVRRVLCRVLDFHGFQPVEATTLSEVMSGDLPHLDAVLLDLHLAKGESGITVLEWLRTQPRYRDTPIMVLTGEAVVSEHDEESIRRNRAYVYFKGQTLLPLMEHLKRLVAKHP